MVFSLLCLCLVIALSGCRTIEPMGVGETDAVECTFTEGSERVRVYLTARGAARVDVQRHDEQRIVHTVFLPANAEEVRRLAGAVDALIASLPAAQGSQVPSAHSVQPAMRLRSERAGRERSTRLSGQELRQSYVWEGVRKEIETVAHADLARAIVWHDIGAHSAEQGKLGDAIFAYQLALERCTEWETSHVHRYDGIWEPEVTMRFRYPDSVDATRGYIVRALPGNVMDLPGITEEWALKLLQYTWDRYTGTVGLTESDGATVVSFDLSWIDGYPDRERAAVAYYGVARGNITAAEINALKNVKPPPWQ